MRLWRLHGPARVLSAGLYPHADGTELRVYFEPERANEVLERQIGDAKILERRAAVLRQQLIDQGWVELANEAEHGIRPVLLKRKTGIVAALSVASGLAFWWWRRRRGSEGQ
jgi:hypothetical protein